MKTKTVSTKFLSSRLSQPAPAAAIALAAGFWLTQLPLWSSVGTTLGAFPGAGIVWSLAAFVLFAVVRLFHSSSRLPVIFGLCSAGLLMALFLYLNHFYISFVWVFLGIALGLAVVGIAIDIERSWHLARSREHAAKLSASTNA